MINIQRQNDEGKVQSLAPPWGLILLYIVSFIIFSMVAFYINKLYLFYGEDGHYMMNLARGEIVWRGLEVGLTNNFLQSLGDVWFPLNTVLIPGYLVATLTNDNIMSAIMAYAIFSFEFFIVGLAISRYIGLNWLSAFVSAWTLPLLAFPYHKYSILYPIMLLVPHLATTIFAANLILILFDMLGKIGNSRMAESVFVTVCIIMLVFYIVISSPAVITLCFPIIAIVCMVGLLSCSSPKERNLKIIFSLSILFCMFLGGMFSYTYGLIKFTAAYYFPNDLLNNRMSWSNVSILFHRKGTCLFVLAFLGAAFFAIFGESSKKVIARGVLVAICSIIGFGILTVNYNFWHGPSPLYFEFFLWPLYVTYAIAFLQLIVIVFKTRVLSKWQMHIPLFFSNINPNLLFSLLLFITSFLMIILLPKPQEPDQVYPASPYKSSIIQVLNREISLAPGKEFRGRVANFTGLAFNRSISWSDLEANDFLIFKKSGNEHRMNGLWFYNIPTLDVYSPLISPSFFQFSRYFFSLPEDKQVRNVMTLRKPNVRWLKALGVRYVITDAPMLDAMLQIDMPLDSVSSLYLYELSSPNLGQYSPTHVIRMTHAEDILKTLMKEAFDPANDIVLDVDLPSKLSQASNVSLFVDKGFIKVKASSHGDTLVLLPLAFSHCLSVISNRHQGEVKLLRANLIQTAIYFQNDLDVSIRYFTGPFRHASCRLEDAKEFEKYNM